MSEDRNGGLTGNEALEAMGLVSMKSEALARGVVAAAPHADNMSPEEAAMWVHRATRTYERLQQKATTGSELESK